MFRFFCPVISEQIFEEKLLLIETLCVFTFVVVKM